MRGFFGIGIFNAQADENLGTLFRSANCFGASFIFTIGREYRHQSTDTMKTPLHLPLYHYCSLADFEEHKPYDCVTVCVEIDKNARDLHRFTHPNRAAYLLGNEAVGLPKEYLQTKQIVQINETSHCLNVSVAGSIVLYDRICKRNGL